MEQARSELTFARFHERALRELVEQADQVLRRLTAMAKDRTLYIHAQVQPGLVPSLPALVENTAHVFLDVSEAVRAQKKELQSAAALEQAVRNLDADLARLREQRATAPFALDRMLPFWSLVFNLREIAQDLKQLESLLTDIE
jgi:uncharacterized protein (DUF3084 family)